MSHLWLRLQEFTYSLYRDIYDHPVAILKLASANVARTADVDRGANIVDTTGEILFA